MKKVRGILVLSVCVGLLVGCGLTTGQPTPEVKTSTSAAQGTPCSGPAITIGDISDNPDEVIHDALPLANYLAEHLASFGIACGNAIVPDTSDKLIALIKDQKVDIYMDSMYPAYLVSEATGAQPILRRWRNCYPVYYSVIFTTTGSGIKSIEDLAGRMVAMDRSYSTSGFALPAVYLMDHGLSLAVKEKFTDPVAANEVGIFFSLDDINTLNLVLEGKVAAAATDDYYFGQWDKEAPGKLAKLAETESMPRQAVLVRAGLGRELQNKIKDLLATCHLDPVCYAIIEGDAQTCMFDDTPEGIKTAFEKMRAMHEQIKNIPGWQDAFAEGR